MPSTPFPLPIKGLQTLDYIFFIVLKPFWFKFVNLIPIYSYLMECCYLAYLFKPVCGLLGLIHLSLDNELVDHFEHSSNKKDYPCPTCTMFVHNAVSRCCSSGVKIVNRCVSAKGD